MIVALGLLLGTGLVLVASPWLWPASGASLRAPRLAEGLRDRLRHAGLGHVPVAVPLVVSVLTGLAVGAVVLLLAPIPALGLAGAGLGAAVPLVVISARARSRRRALRLAWPDLVDHLVAGIRSGVPLAEAIGSLAQVGPVETRPAFREFARVALGAGTVTVALDRLKDALADPVADRIVETVRMARDVGGTELPSVLRALAASLRQEAAVRAEVEARQSWIRGAARLGIAAPWLVLLLLASRPEAASAYNSPGGLVLLAAGLVVTVVAYRIMLALGRLPEERRWFA